MKKLILFLLPLFALAQNPTNFPYGIKNAVAPSNSTPTYFVTQEVDGAHKKTPATLIAKTTDLDLKQTVFTGIDQKQFLTENDIAIDNNALTLTIATVKNGTTISAMNPVRFFTDGSGVAVMHEKKAPVVFNFTNTTGVWYFYFNSSGTPIATQTIWNDYSNTTSVYRFYWNATLGVADRRVIESVEYHKNDISWSDHTWKNLQGAQWVNGLTVSSNAIASGIPNVNGSNAVITLSSGTIVDDNLFYTLTNAATGSVKFTQNLGTGLLPATSGKFITISNDTGGLLQKLPATDFPFLWNVGTNSPEYLTVNGTRTAVGNNNFFVYYVYALQDPRYGETIKIKSAETDFVNSTLAEAHNWEQLQALFPTLRDGEIRLLYKLTFEYKSTYDVGTKKAALRKVDDLRKQKTTSTAVASGVVPATSVIVSPVGGIASTNAQSALQELDSETVKLTGDQTITGTKTFNKTGTTTNIVSNNTASGIGISSNNTSLGIGIYSNNIANGFGFFSDNTASGTGIRSNNTSNGFGIYSDNTGIGDGIVSNSYSTGKIYVGKNSGITTYSVNKEGETTGTKFIKSGAAAANILLAGGTDIPQSTFATATLTSGYIPKAAGANSLVDSSIFDNGTNVGIGTTSPTAKLQVNGTVDNQAAAYFYNYSGVAGQSKGLFIEAGSNSSDYSVSFNNKSGSSLFLLRGDGQATFASSVTASSYKIDTTPTTSTGAYDILTRNPVNGVLEKISSSLVNILPSNNTFTGENTFSNYTIFGSSAKLKNYTVATLPEGNQGDIAFVTDALAPTYMTTVVGGGTVVTPVFYNGTAWVAH